MAGGESLVQPAPLVAGESIAAKHLRRLGYKIVVCPIASLLITASATHRLVNTFISEGRVDGLADEMMTFAQIKQLLGLDEVMSLRERLEKTLW